MKKYASLALISILALSSMTVTFATDESINLIGSSLADKYSTVEEGNSSEILALPSSGSVIATPEKFNIFSMFSTKSTLTYTHKVRCIQNAIEGTKAVATSDATEPIDYIYARVKTYNYDDSLLNEAEDSATNASHAGAKANNGSGVTWGDYAYGNHVFKNEGYKDVVKETSDTW